MVTLDRSFCKSQYDFFYSVLDINKKLLDKAMKEGYVTAKWSKFSVSGAPGTGKSSFLKLLYNEPPPEDNNSTSVVATYETRRVDVIPAIVDHDLVWKKIDHNSLKEKIAQVVKDGIRHHKSEKIEEHGSLESMPLNQPSESMSITHPLKESNNQPTNPQEETADSHDLESSTTKRHDAIVTQEIVDLLPHVDKSEELYQSHWIYGINSGGLAAFIDIAPALLQYHSVNILTHKLTERLDDKVKFFYSIKGNEIEQPEEKQLTNLQLLEASFCLLSSPKLSNSHIKNYQEPRCIALGTFYDEFKKPGLSGESLKDKNSCLLSTLEKCDLSDTTIMHLTAEKEVIFPVNTIARGDNEEKMAERIRREICQYYIEVKVPVRWFLFQLELYEYQKSSLSKSSVGIISKSKCLEVGKSLQMEADDIEAALMYYHDMTIFLYFPSILSDVVFLHPQLLFNKLSDLISIFFADTINHLKCNIRIPPKDYNELKDEGSFNIKLLSSHLRDGFSSDFSEHDFVKLMTGLFIMGSLPEKGKYFLPTVLSNITVTEQMLAPFKNKVDPLIISWNMKPVPRGVFPALVVSLLNYEGALKFQLIDKHLSSSIPRSRNAIALRINTGNVFLVDGVCWIALYCSDPDQCSAIREIVHNRILQILSHFNFMANEEIPKEYFYCTIPKCTSTSLVHFCNLHEDKETLSCVKTLFTITVNSRQQPWLPNKSKLRSNDSIYLNS